MKIKAEVLSILLILTFSSILSFVNMPLIPSVKATYVEGLITQDTVWTLVDSPFVISNEIVICEGATLTIEPEVEVRFGGRFSITVEGRLVAEGTSDKMIKFTSNGLQPEAGNWGAIRFNSTKDSSLVFCIIEYGANGTLVENGSVQIQNSVIQFNLNGITVLGGSVTIGNSLVANNTLNGIYIAGGQVNMQENVINSNGDGIFLTGNLTTSEISINHNEISFNRHSGILHGANAYESTIAIRNNVISNNSYGFYVSTDNATLITRNYILNNGIGVFYEKGTEHKANFNDICDNDLGMDVSPEAFADATYNYWGSKSGPHHEFLNPRGKGNSVGGDGVNLDFIFFLTHPIDYENSNPTAVLWTDKLVVAPNCNVTFVGTDSYDDGQVNQYLFDFGDGTTSDWTTLSLFTHSYSSMGTYTASLMVIDDFNTVSANAYVEVNVVDLPPLDISMALSNYTVAHNEEVVVTIYVSDGVNAIGNANVSLFSIKGGSFTYNHGITNSSGYFVTTFKAPDVTEITDVRIIARASKDFYADGSDYTYLKVLPPLTAYVTADPSTVKSEETATVTVYVMDSFGEPVSDASLTLSSENGILSAITGFTDLNGTATFDFTACQTLTQIEGRVAVTVVKAGYETQQVQVTIPIEPKILVVDVTADPQIIISEETSLITVHVTCDSIPVSNVTVMVSSDVGGNFSEILGYTDLDGNVTFIFTAPKVTVKDGIYAIITVTATKDGYVSGEDYAVIAIKPKILSVQIIAEPDVTVSEGKVSVKVQVTYNGSSVAEANVTLSDHEGFETLMSSGYDGVANFVYTAPLADTPRKVTLWAVATKDGYVDGEDTLTITVNPGILDVEITVNPYPSVTSENPVIVTVYVSHEQTPAANATVNITFSNESIPSATNLTDASGYCTFVFVAPQTTAQLSIDIVLNATKYGYQSCEKQTSMIVNPKVEVEKPAEGWPLTTILLIVIPVVIAVVVFVLVKLKILVVSFAEEEE